MSGFAKNGVLYPCNGIFGIKDDTVSSSTGWSSQKVMEKLTHVKSIIRVDAKPTLADGTITYVKDGTTYTTTDQESWFYYIIDDLLYKTTFIDGVEYTKDDSDVILDDYVEKASIITELNDTCTDEQIPTAKVVNDKLSEVFQNVDNGKSLIASAITDKGVNTSKDDTFSTMAENIKLIVSGSDITLIHNAMEELGYNYTDLTYTNIEKTAELIKKYFILKSTTQSTTYLVNANEDLNFDSGLTDAEMQDFGSVINPMYTKTSLVLTKNETNNLYISPLINTNLVYISQKDGE